MPPQPLLNLPHHRRLKPLIPLHPIKNFVHKPSPHQLLHPNPPTHNQRLVRQPHAQPLHQRAAGAALGDEAEGGERGEEEGGRARVDEVGVGDEGGREADGGAVEGGDEDFGVGVEGLGYVEVVGEEGAEPVLAGVFGGGV